MFGKISPKETSLDKSQMSSVLPKTVIKSSPKCEVPGYDTRVASLTACYSCAGSLDAQTIIKLDCLDLILVFP